MIYKAGEITQEIATRETGIPNVSILEAVEGNGSGLHGVEDDQKYKRSRVWWFSKFIRTVRNDVNRNYGYFKSGWTGRRFATFENSAVGNICFS